MKRKQTIYLFAILMIVLAVGGARAELVTRAEAELIASNWIDAAVSIRGGWGEVPEAEVASVEEFVVDGRTLGFVCNVDPQGFILVTALKGLAPVKAWSYRKQMPSGCDVGMCEVLRGKLKQVVDYVEANLGPMENLRPATVGQFLDRDLTPIWSEVLLDRPTFHSQVLDGLVGRNYLQGEELIQSQWHQRPPFNDDCPIGFCTWEGECNYNMNTFVGCVALAGSQIMRHWNWPPTGWVWNFDWQNMLDEYPTAGGCNWDPVTVDAVAHLAATVGSWVGMDYGCDGSSAYTEDMEGVYELMSYSDNCSVIWREDYSTMTWFDQVANQLNGNQVCHYRIQMEGGGGHSLVLDGYNSIGLLYHFHYGWGPQVPGDFWFVVDNIDESILADEYMLINICPSSSLGSQPSGSYPPNVLPRYVTRDANGYTVDIQGPQEVKFFPHTVFRCADNYVKFHGGSPEGSKLYVGLDETVGIQIWEDAALVLHEEGCVKIE